MNFPAVVWKNIACSIKIFKCSFAANEDKVFALVKCKYLFCICSERVFKYFHATCYIFFSQPRAKTFVYRSSLCLKIYCIFETALF